MKKKDIGQGVPVSTVAAQLKLEIVGNKDALLQGLTAFDTPLKGHIAFSAEQRLEKLKKQLIDTPLAALIVHSSIDCGALPPGIAYIGASDPMRSFIDVVPFFFEPYPRTASISPKASVSSTAKLGENVFIGDFVSIGDGCTIGDGVTIHPNVVIYHEVRIGAGTVIHSGAIIRERIEIGAGGLIQPNAVIGADGFGYIPDPAEGIRAVPQVGMVRLGAKVDIGANACVDRGAFSDTILGQGTKLDNLVQIGHNVRVGSYTIICGGTVVAGSTEIGNQVTIGGNSAIAGHIKIHDKVRLAGHSAATSTLEKGDYGGFPAMPVSVWRRQVASLRKLPELFSRAGRIKQEKDVED